MFLSFRARRFSPTRSLTSDLTVQKVAHRAFALLRVLTAYSSIFRRAVLCSISWIVAEHRVKRWKCLLLCTYQLQALGYPPPPPPPPRRTWGFDCLALPGGGEFDHEVGYGGGAYWPTPVCTVISACIGWGCLTISPVPGWGFRIHLTPPWSNPHHLRGGGGGGGGTVGHAIDRCKSQLSQGSGIQKLKIRCLPAHWKGLRLMTFRSMSSSSMIVWRSSRNETLNSAKTSVCNFRVEQLFLPWG